jgi:hypothetical protein
MNYKKEYENEPNQELLNKNFEPHKDIPDINPLNEEIEQINNNIFYTNKKQVFKNNSERKTINQNNNDKMKI